MGEARRTRLPFVWIRARCQDQGAPESELEKRWTELFEQLDVNKDGKIDITELRNGLAAWGLDRSDPDEVSQAGTRTQGQAFAFAPIAELSYIMDQQKFHEFNEATKIAACHLKTGSIQQVICFKQWCGCSQT